MSADIVEIAKDLQMLAAARRLQGDRGCTELDIVTRAIRAYRIWTRLSEVDREYIGEYVQTNGRSPFMYLRNQVTEAESIALNAYEQVKHYGGYRKDGACKVCIGEDEAAKMPEHLQNFTCWFHKAEALLPKG